MPVKKTAPLPTDIEAAQALSHPIRSAAFRLLASRQASPKQIAQELGESLGTVSYHVRELLKLHCVELVDTIPRRGAIEHIYRATATATITVESLPR